MLLGLGRARMALQDFSKVLAMKPGFSQARLQRANVYLKMAELDLAHMDIEAVVRCLISFLLWRVI